jgi:hypothetical protein
MDDPENRKEAKERRAFAVALVLVLASALAFLPASDASSQSPSGGTISGTVTDANAVPLKGICVTAWSNSVWPGKTAANGGYEIFVVPGTYKVEFSVCEGGNYLGEWFNDQPDRTAAASISIAAGQTFDADASLATGGKITGTITNDAGQPLVGACAYARRQQDLFPHLGISDPTGNYTIEGLGPGAHQVFFSHCDAGSYINEYYDNHPDEQSADPVAVTIGQTTPGINASLAVGATISGRVVGFSGQPVEHVCVHAHRSEFDSSAPHDETDANGDYAIEGAPSGTYRVVFVPCSSAPYGLEWYDNKANWASADPVTAAVGSTTTGIDADLSTRPPPPPPVPPNEFPDTFAPDVSIGSGPSGKTSSRRPSFAFSSSDPSARFECAVDALDLAPCTSPTRMKTLKYGKHSFSVVAIDPSANRSPLAERKFKVTKKKPKDR